MNTGFGTVQGFLLYVRGLLSTPWKNPRMRSLVGGALITTDPANAVDDYTPTTVPQGTTIYKSTIYSYQIV